MESQESFLQRFKDWYYDNDLHLWLGAVTIIAGVAFVWILHKETERNFRLLSDIAQLREDLVVANSKIFSLTLELDAQKKASILANQSKPVEDTVNKASTKLTDKMDKIQKTLIDKTISPVVKVETKTKTIERTSTLPVDKELNTLMLEAYCINTPERKECAKVKTK